MTTTLPEPVEEIAGTVATVPGVAALDGGRFGESTTYLPGRRVAGVVDRGDLLTVTVTARAGQPLPALAARIRIAVATLDPRPVEVVITDLDLA